jgi:putative transposase
MDILKRQFPIKLLIFLKSNCHAKMAPDNAIVYLFVDGIAERLRSGQRWEAILAVWGIGEDGRKSHLGLMAGSKEDVETVRAFSQDLRARGFGDPLLVVSDGAPGIIRAIEECFTCSARQRCLAHRMRNLAAKVPTDPWPKFKARVTACYQAPLTGDRAATGDRHPRRLRHVLPSALTCFEDDSRAASPTCGCRLRTAAALQCRAASR